ncbi:HVO_2523 family zinc finger protein [Halorussus pelagicus]|uniref:HVO_2523 family zinc finger protein n=1 Tax=Halorussus pelagicus TaxID=2505977 RepID=UPI00140857E2|nr:HVO_2523 family zinc finger protein [Halorussus pelagicus]
MSDSVESGDGDDTSSEQGGRPCPICETPLYSRHCKYVCPQHGVIMDCADTFY